MEQPELGLIDPKTQTNLNIYFQIITPSQAQKMLKDNHKNNRAIKTRVVDSYVRQMERKLWKSDNGEGISISQNGKLVNGQHRLAAIIKYGKPVSMMIISGVPEESIKSIDDGVKRTLSDAMMISGKQMPNQSSVNMALRALMTLKTCGEKELNYESVHGARRNTTSELIAFYDQLPNFGKKAEKFFSTFKYSKLAKSIPAGIALALYYLFDDVDDTICFSIFKSYETGIPFDDLRDLSPTYHVISKTRRHRELKMRIRPSEHIMMFVWCFIQSAEQRKPRLLPQLPWNWNLDNLIIKSASRKLAGVDA